MPQADGATERASASRDRTLRRAHAVLKQRTKLAYAAPRLVLLPAHGDGNADPVLTFLEARTARRLSIDELARRSGISPSTIYRIQYGKTRPRPHVVHALSTALGLAPQQIAEFRRRSAV